MIIGGLFMILGGMLLELAPTIHWFNNPSMTAMEVFREFWANIVVGYALLLAGWKVLEIGAKNQ